MIPFAAVGGAIKAALIGEAQEIVVDSINAKLPVKRSVSKGALTSKTLQGILISAVGAILARYGIGDEALAVEIGVALMQFGGAAWAFYGRIKATKPIGKSKRA